MDVKEMIGLDGNNILKSAKDERGLTLAQLADRMGLKQSAVSGQINRGRVSLDAFENILRVMEYDVVIVDRKSGEVKWLLDSEL